VSTRQKRTSRLPGLIVPGLCLAIMGYFAYHAQTGKYSIHTQSEMNEEALRLQFVLSDLQHQRKKLAARVNQLTNGTLERDALDEITRRELGYSAQNEVIILY
jgi:cell division protein FtsB